MRGEPRPWRQRPRLPTVAGQRADLQPGLQARLRASRAQGCALVRVPATHQAWAALDAALRDLTGEVRVLVAEFESRSELGGRSAEASSGSMQPDFVARVQELLARPDLVSIAVVAQPVDAPAAAVSLAFDLRLLGGDAALAFCDPAMFGSIGRLRDLVGPARALELCLTGRRLSALQAADLGIADAVLAADELAEAVDDLVAALLSTPRAFATEVKAALASSGRGSLADARRTADELGAARRLARDDEWE